MNTHYYILPDGYIVDNMKEGKLRLRLGGDAFRSLVRKGIIRKVVINQKLYSDDSGTLMKMEFKRYVKSIKIPDHMLIQYTTPIDWNDDDYLKKCVDNSRQLSYQCIENVYARKEKQKLVYRVLSYLSRNNFSCDSVFDNLYSKNNPKSMQKACELRTVYRDEFLLRQQYIGALDEVRSNYQNLSELFAYLEGLAEYPEYANGKYEISKVKNATTFLHDTEKYKDSLPTGKNIIADMAIYIRNKYLDYLDNSLDDGAILAFWLSGRYELLSNGNLKKLGDLLCDVYKLAYKSEIKIHRQEKKKDYDRKRHTPTKRLSAQEKREKVKELKTNGHTQKETVELLETSKSTVERYWNN